VLGVGEELPFRDASFDAVISIAVLEHVRNPFRCADEIVRVLKPGGRLICCAPFLQPYHGYPSHYYNMSWQGLRALFEDQLRIDDHKVTGSMGPIWSLTWMIQSWAEGLEPAVRERFLDLKLKDLMGPPRDYLERDFVRDLPQAKTFELASATMIFATKPDQGEPPAQGLRLDHYSKGARRPTAGWLRKLFRR
jgi:SAM-dependent methyltransferase